MTLEELKKRKIVKLSKIRTRNKTLYSFRKVVDEENNRDYLAILDIDKSIKEGLYEN